MVENRPWLTFFCHAFLIASIAAVAFPLDIAFVASTNTAERMFEIPIPLLPGGEAWHNYTTVLAHGVPGTSTAPVGRMMLNSLVMASALAMTRAVAHLRANPAEAKSLIAEFTKSKRELVEQVPIDDWSTEISVADVAATLKVMQQEGLLKKPMDAKSLIHDLGR